MSNGNEATTTRPPRRDHDDEKTTYNNQLNGGPSAVEVEVRGGGERWR
jgi:hypothetical protein